MEYFLPSEIGRLVLGYLKEENYKQTYQIFLKECTHLKEYALLLRGGREYPTTIDGKNLKEMLHDYGQKKLQESKLKASTIHGLWLKHDSLITQIKSHCRANKHCATHSTDGDASQAQGVRLRRHNHPTPREFGSHSSATSNLQQPSSVAHEPSDKAKGENDKVPGSESDISDLPSRDPGAAVAEGEAGGGDSDSDPGLVVETEPPTLTAVTGTVPHTSSPAVLGGVRIDISTGEAVPREPAGASNPPSALSEPQASTSGQSVEVQGSDAQENNFTNHQRQDSPSSLPKLRKDRLAKSSKKDKEARHVNPKRARTSKSKGAKRKSNSDDQEGQLNTEEQPTQDLPSETSTEIPNDEACTETSHKPITPKKLSTQPLTAVVAKSPRRKCPAPKRRSIGREELASAQITNCNSSNEDKLNMPMLDDLINNFSFVDKVAQTINRVKQSTEPDNCETGNILPPDDPGAPDQNKPNTELGPESKRKRKKSKKKTTRKGVNEEKEVPANSKAVEVASEENIENVLHIQDNVVTQEAVKSILEMTETDPDFDILFHMFNTEKAISFDEAEKPCETPTDLPETASPVKDMSPSPELASTGEKTGTLNDRNKLQMASVLYPGTESTPPYVKVVKVRSIREVSPKDRDTSKSPPTSETDSNTSTSTASASSGSAETKADNDDNFFKVPDPPRNDKTKEKEPEVPSVEDSNAKQKPKRGGVRTKKAKKLGIATKKRSGSTDSSDSGGGDQASLQSGSSDPSKAPVTAVQEVPLTYTVPSTSQCTVLDLGHVQAPATISLVPADGSNMNVPPDLSMVSDTIQPEFTTQALQAESMSGESDLTQIERAAHTQGTHQVEPLSVSSTLLEWSTTSTGMKTVPSVKVDGGTDTPPQQGPAEQQRTTESDAPVYLDRTPVSQPAPIIANSTGPPPTNSQSLTCSRLATDSGGAQTPRPVKRCLNLEESVPGVSGASASRMLGVTPLSSSPFYSNPETPGLGAHEVVDLNSPVAVSPYSAMAAGMQQQQQQPQPETTPRTSKPSTKFPHEPGSARTRYSWPQLKSLIAEQRSRRGVGQAPLQVSEAEETKLESPVKENKTPEKEPREGGGTPLATKEAEAAATMVAMASTPVKKSEADVDFSHLPAASALAVRHPGEQTVQTQTVPVPQSPSNKVRGEQLLKTPTKQRTGPPHVVSPERSPLLNKLIQVSAGAFMNGHTGSKRPSEKGNREKPRKAKRLKMSNMDVDKFLEKLHSTP